MPSISPRIQNKVCLAARTQSVDAFEEADIDGDAAKCICEMAASPPTLHHHPPPHHCHSLVHQLCALNLASHSTFYNSTSQRGAALSASEISPTPIRQSYMDEVVIVQLTHFVQIRSLVQHSWKTRGRCGHVRAC